MSIKLRPYQEECLQSINAHFEKGINRQLVHLPTAAGKTIIFASLIKQRKCRTIVLAHTCELLDQAKDKINMICPSLDVGIVNAHKKEFDKSVVVSTIQSARQPENLKQLQNQGFRLCIADECHLFGASSPRAVLDALGFGKDTNHLLVGCSATPWREDNKGLGEVFEKVVYHKSIKDLISLGYLCQPKGIRIQSDLDLSSVLSADGDFIPTSLASVMDTPQMNELVVNAYIDHAVDRKTVCFAVTIAHAKNLTDAFKSRGIASEFIHGETPIDQRKDLLEKFREGAISVLTNCMILTTGWDEPSVDCVLVAKPTQSKGLYQQICGRGLRLYPNKKDCLILDFGSETHSLCSTALLTNDIELENIGYRKDQTKISEFVEGLPPSINKKLKASMYEFDLLGDAFTWIKEGQSFSLKAIGNKTLKIFPTAEGRFSVIYFNGNISQTVSKDMSFEYAFSSAEEFAKDHRSLFTVSDLEASWRRLPITDKQKSLFKSFGYKKGIEDLSRGQASLIISSGKLNKKAARI